MKILHYSLGFPPYRSGGMTKFCVDIMRQQKNMGHEIALLWPGEMRLNEKNVLIKEKNSWYGIRSFEIINPLPISYDEGIQNVTRYMVKCDSKNYGAFLDEFAPDVIHLHTLMGLHQEFLDEAKKRGIRSVFSMHDFFPICPKVTMFNHGKICATAHTCVECPQCNITALSINKIIMLQSNVYRFMKNSPIITRLRKHHRDSYLSEENRDKSKENIKVDVLPKDYKNLRNYYENMINYMDMIHFNSSVTKFVYETFFQFKNTSLISISHADIHDCRRYRKYGSELKLTYLGAQSSAKGYFILKAALDELWSEQKDFILNLYFEPTEQSPYMEIHEQYQYSELEKIFDETDILVAPSLWYETFGYTVLEALSFGVPVMISDTVGAKDILPPGCGIVIEKIDEKKLKEAIQSLSEKKLEKMNSEIMQCVRIKTVESMTEEIMSQCYF